jgi:hypothetical protein
VQAAQGRVTQLLEAASPIAVAAVAQGAAAVAVQPAQAAAVLARVDLETAPPERLTPAAVAAEPTTLLAVPVVQAQYSF